MKKLTNNTKALFLLWLLILFSCLIIFRHFIFGDEFAVFNDVGSDTLQQYLNHYNSIINAIRDKNLSLWDFTNGFGTSMYSLNLFQPLLFLLYLAGVVVKPIHLPHLMVYLEIGQIFLAATVCFFYLNEFKFSRKAKVIAAYLYGLNGYLLVWGQHYQFGLYVILLPLLLLLAERAFKKRRFSFLLTLGVSLTVLGSIYMSYMTLLILGLYLLFRTISIDDSFRTRIKLFLMNCGSILLGIGMVMVIFLPSASYLMSISSRLETEGSLLSRFIENLTPFSLDFYKTAFYRLFSSNLYGISDNYSGVVNYYEAPILFIGVLFVILIVQYLFTIHRQEVSKKAKALQYIALILVAFFVFIKAGSMIFNAFAYAFSRHTFAFMPFAALMMAFTLDQILYKKRLSYAGLGISALLFALVYSNNPGTIQASPEIICLLGMLMIGVLILAYQKKRVLSSALISALLLVLVMTNMIYDSYHDYNNRNTLKRSDSNYFEQLYGKDVTEALTYLKDNDTSFYRVEKDYDAGSYCMDGSTQNYFGVSTYNSAPNKNVQEFINRLWPGLERMSPSMFSYRQTVYDAEMASLVNIKYLISHNPKLDVEGFTLLKQFGSIYVYQNGNTDSLGKFYTNAFSSRVLPEDTSKIDMDRFISENLILDEGFTTEDASLLDDYALENVDYSIKKKKFTETDKLMIPLDQSKLKGYERMYLDFTITVDTTTVFSVSLNDSFQRYFYATGKKPVHVRMRIPESCTQITITPTTDTFSGKMKKIKFYGSKTPVFASPTAAVNFAMPEVDTEVVGTVNTSTEGVLMVSIPYENGWSAYVDGEEAEVHRADYGFMGLKLSAGNHDIRFQYQPPGLYAGLMISCLCTLLFVILGVIRKTKTIK